MSKPSESPSFFSLFAKQERVYPKRVSGKFRNLKWIAMVVCLAIYYLAPFIRWDRGPYAPDQAILIDLPARRAYWFWIEIWPQEVYILTGILILAAIALFFVTSMFGRVWCGYFCFQTIWTDLFVWVERIVQGDRNKRKRLREVKWTFEKTWKIALTHTLWLIIAWWTAGSFVLYFNDAPTLVKSFFTGDVSTTVLGFIAGLTFMTYMMAGFAREQVCTFMCPYARFQSAMFDKDTLIIGYDEARGEPRGKHKKGESWEGLGDCVDCSLCVQVCPTGIDIRKGLQMECIACGLCADACDTTMEKVGLPLGLIKYDTERRIEERAAGKKESPIKLLRPRTVVYTLVLGIVGGAMLYTLITRPPFEMNVLHDRNPLFVKLSNGDIRNGYRIKVQNKTHQHQNFALSIDGLDGANIRLNNPTQQDLKHLHVHAGQVGQFKVFVQASAPKESPKDFRFILTNEHDTDTEVATVFVSQRPND